MNGLQVLDKNPPSPGDWVIEETSFFSITTRAGPPPAPP